MNALKKSATIAAMSLVVNSAWATPVYHPPGANLTYGDLSNGQSIVSEINNPAAGAAVLQKGEGEGQFRFGLISSVGAGGEIGDVADLYNEVDAMSTDFQNDFSNLLGPNPTPGDLATAITTLDNEFTRVNDLLSLVEKDGYAKGFFSGHVPLMPIVITSNALGGSLVFDANVSVAANVNFLQQNINFDATETGLPEDFATYVAAIAGAPLVDRSYVNGDFTVNYIGATQTYDYALGQNDSSLVLKGSLIKEVAMGYSRLLMGSGDNSLFWGLRGKYYQTELYRKFQPFNLNTGTETTFDDVNTDNAASSTGFGVDFGLLWVMKNFRLGATYVNLNEPTFDYNGADLPVGYTYADARILSELNKSSTYTMESQLKLEAAFYSNSRNWVLGASMDANPVEDPFGAEYQWATASIAYASDTFILPGFRFGYRQNMAGTEMSYAQAGLTWLFINLDVAYGLDKIVIDNEEQPRSVMANIGIEFSF